MTAPRIFGIAQEPVGYGAHVLCRGFAVSNASPAIANGIAQPRPASCEATGYAAGEHVTVEPIEGLGGRDLHALAAGPIMDPCRIYLPAGRLSKAEAAARDAANWQRLA